MNERRPSAESIRSSDGRVSQLSRFALLSLQLTANLPLHEATSKLRAVSANYSRYDELSFTSMASYELSFDDYSRLTHRNSSLNDAKKKIESFLKGGLTQYIYLDRSQYEVKSTPRGVGLAFKVDDSSTREYRSMLSAIHEVDSSIRPSPFLRSNGVYARFMASDSVERDIALVSLHSRLKSLSGMDPEFMTASKPKLIVRYS